MTELATEQIQEIFRIYRHVQSIESPSQEVLDLLEEAQGIIQNQSAIDLAFLTASPKQIRLAEDFWDDEFDVIAWVGANRSGKSWGAGRLCAARWIRDKGYAGARVWCVSQTFKASVAGTQRELWEALPQERFSKPWNDEYGFGDRSVVTYRAGNGKKKEKVTINFMNEEQGLNVFETVPVDIVWWDEAHRESLFGRLMMRTLDRTGKILISTIPEELWLKMRIEESNNERFRHEVFTTYDNKKNLPEGKIDEIAAGLSPEEYRMRILGEYVSLTGLCFPEFNNMLAPEGNLLETGDKLPEDDDRNQSKCDLFIDCGVHTAALLLVVTPEGNMIVWDEVYARGLRVDEVCDLVRDMLKLWGLRVENLTDVAMDPAGWAVTASNELTLADEYAKAGIQCRRWLRTRDFGGGERAMINKVRTAFRDKRLFVNDKCINTIREMRTWRWVMDEGQRIDLRERPARTDNHACDAVKAWVGEDPSYANSVSGVYDTADDLEYDGQEDWQEDMV